MQRISVLTTIIFAAAAFSACGSQSAPSASKTKAPVAECSDGDTKPADDGCNTCTCDENGNWACTEMACVAPSDAGAEQCSAGDTKPADDGCNSCTCDENGNWGCTEMGCGDS